MRVLLLFLFLISCSEEKVSDSIFMVREDSSHCFYELYYPKNDKLIPLEKLGECATSVAVDRINQQVFYSLEKNIVKKDIRTQKLTKYKIPNNNVNGLKELNGSIVLWISPKNELYFARTVLVEEGRVKISKVGKQETWEVNYQGNLLTDDLVIGSPTIYEVQKLDPKKMQFKLVKAYLRGGEFDEAPSMLSVVRSEIKELKDSISMAGSETVSPFGNRKDYYGSLDVELKKKIKEKIITSDDVHSVQNIKAERGIFFYGNRSDGYIYLSGPLLYLPDDKSDIETYYDGNTSITPVILANYFLIVTGERLDIFSLKTGKRIKSFKSIVSCRGYLGTKSDT